MVSESHKFSALTLNCWGVFTPLAVEYRHERLAEIAKTLSEGEHDICFLQEIWTLTDFAKIEKVMRSTYPYRHYFHSNLIGSGCCIFSKHPIVETFYHRFTLNSFPQRVWHGDWFGGKGVGLAKVELPGGFRLACFVTHFVAEYHREADDYNAHRVAQAFELSTFVRLAAAGSDAYLVAGDLNLRSHSVGYEIIVNNAALRDAWLDQSQAPSDPEVTGATCERPGNSFTSKKSAQLTPYGERLDYMLYGSNAGSRLQCEVAKLCMGKIPGRMYNYSDHEAVEANFTIQRNPLACGDEGDVEKRSEAFRLALNLFEERQKQVLSDRIIYALLALLAVLVIHFARAPGEMVPFCWLPYVFNVVFIVLAAMYLMFAVWTSLVIKEAERRALIDASLNMRNLLSREKKSVE